eukprot:Selendium_serpulae@DN4989_c0_g1_i1.p1
MAEAQCRSVMQPSDALVCGASLGPVHGDVEVRLALVAELGNAAELAARTAAAPQQQEERGVIVLVDPRLVLNTDHVLTAALRAVNNRRLRQMKTHDLRAELLYCLSPSSNIAQSLAHFGFKADSGALLLVCIAPRAAAPLDAVSLFGRPMVSSGQCLSVASQSFACGRRVPLSALDEFNDSAAIAQVGHSQS